MKAFYLKSTAIVILFTCSLLVAETIEPNIQLNNIVWDYADKQGFAEPTCIFLDAKRGEIYLCDPNNHKIGLFDLKGTNLCNITHWVKDQATGERIEGSPQAVVVTSSGNIIVSDNQTSYIDVLDYRGNSIQTIKANDFANVKSFAGVCLALDKAENLYIGVNNEAPEILKLDSNFNLLMRFGEKGTAPEQFTNISGIYIDIDGKMYITDSFAIPVVKIFDSTGQYLSGFGTHDEAKTDFSLAAGVVKTSGGRIWIVDTLRQVVKCMTENGDFVTMIGGLGQEPGDMWYPSSAASDGDTLLIVAEKVGNRFQQFTIK